MDCFAYRSGRLCCENVDLGELAAELGTPVYVYSAGTLRRHYTALADAFAPVDPTIWSVPPEAVTSASKL